MKLKGRNKVSPDFSMSSMTDIVFLLLIFFMLTANSPNALDLLLPKAKGKSTNTQNVSVSIDKNLQYYINNERINGEYIEIERTKALEGQENPTMNLTADETVAITEAVNVMHIANRTNYTAIIAERPN